MTLNTSQTGNSTHCFIIAEAGVNHNGDMTLAYKLIDAAKAAGADAVKFQCFDPATLTSTQAPLANYQQSGTQQNTQQKMLEELALTHEQFRDLQQYANKVGILFLCSPFDETAATFLANDLSIDCLKIASGELTNIPFLKHVATLGKPVIISTGMATQAEVEQAVAAFPQGFDLSILHCVSAYPAPASATNLKAITTLQQHFPSNSIGFSDHSMGWHITVAAVALGATIIEKHLTLDTTMTGPDHAASLNPTDFKTLVDAVRAVSESLGDGIKQPAPIEQDCINVARKSLIAAQDLPAGHIITAEDIVIKRPGTGISPAQLEVTIGKRLSQNVAVDTPLTSEMLD